VIRPPIELTGTEQHFGPAPTAVDGAVLAELGTICPCDTTAEATAEASRDWWPLALHWSLAGEVPRRAAVVCRPRSTEEVSRVLAVCDRERIPVTAAGGRSGVCGASVPAFGGVVLDTTALRGLAALDETSLVVEVWAGTFGPELEADLRARGYTCGHFPQSFDIATVGGWVACRGAGQYSTRYGKIEDIVCGLEVVLADGTVVRTGGAPRAAVGPDLTQLFTGAEGTLGVITRVWLRVHPVPAAERRAAWWFSSFAAGMDACRRILRRGATPAVLRLYDAEEAARSHGGDGSGHLLLVLDEADPALVDATMAIVAEECAATPGATTADVGKVEGWLAHRNDTSALQALVRKGFVVDTMEIAGRWEVLPAVFDAARAAIRAVPHAITATCHASHSYLDGACLYFTFAATPPPDQIDVTYRALWDAGTTAVLAAGGNLSHHHGVGMNRGRFVAAALGTGHGILGAVKSALDPHGILNPGKLGLPSAFGELPAEWTAAP
jgi:alkyldihydroxyacetonephosphate synthase